RRHDRAGLRPGRLLIATPDRPVAPAVRHASPVVRAARRARPGALIPAACLHRRLVRMVISATQRAPAAGMARRACTAARSGRDCGGNGFPNEWRYSE